MITGLIALLFAFLAAVFLLVGLIPLLGWLNWITSLPLAIIGLAFAQVSAKRGNSLGVGVRILCLALIVLALFRLLLGHGLL